MSTRRNMFLAGVAAGVLGLGVWVASENPKPAPAADAGIDEGRGWRPATGWSRSGADQRFEDLLAEFAEEPDGGVRERAIDGLVELLSIGELVAGLDAYSDSPQDDVHHGFWLKLLERWSREDARAAADWAETITDDPSLRDEAMRFVAICWANADLMAAKEWVEDWLDAGQREQALTAVTYEGARTDPVAALQIAADLPLDQENENLVHYATSQWAASDPAAAVQWARQTEDAVLRDSLVADIAVTWSARDPAAASALVDELAPGPVQANAAVGVAQRWFQHDPAAVCRWIESFSEVETRAAAMRSLVSIGMQQNVARTTGMVEGLSPGATRDAAIAELALQLAPREPASSAAWIARIENTALKRQIESAIEGSKMARP